MVRKPTSWKEVDEDFVSPDRVYESFTAEQLGVYDDVSVELRLVVESLVTGRRLVVPDKFMLERAGKKYLVERSGYNYIRYIHRIR